MTQRSKLEDKYTLTCKVCGYQMIDPHKHPRQKYIKDCPECKRKGSPLTRALNTILKEKL